MTVFNKKSRMISFRLTADEYTEAVNRCQQQGYRSVSSLARTATLGNEPGIAATMPAKPSIDANDFLDMQDQIFRLRTEIDRISALMPNLIGDPSGPMSVAAIA